MTFALSPRMKRILRWVGYPLLALVSFVFALQLTFPYDRVAARMKEALMAKYDVTIGEVDRGFWPGTMTISSIGLTPRPTKAGEQPATLLFSDVHVGVGLLGLLGGTAGIHIDAELGHGEISGTVALSSSTTTLSLVIDDVNAETVPGLAGVVGLPVGGKLDGEVSLELPKGDARQAEGKVDIGCKANCTIGDGVAKIYPKGKTAASAAWGKEGMTVAKLLLHDWSAEMTLVKGKLDITKFEFHSDDGEIFVDFHAQIQKVLKDSPVTGCIKFKASEVLKKREPKFGNGLDITGAPLGPDNYYYVKLAGTLGDVKRQPFICSLDGSEVPGQKTQTSVDSTGHFGGRPRITPTPTADEPVRPTPTVPPPPPPPIPAPTPAVGSGTEPPPPGAGSAGSGAAPAPQQFERMAPPPNGEAPPPPPPPPPGEAPPQPGGEAGTGSGASAPIIVN
ncbi:MAG: type II secretion system protein GspN [Deltaproteobacteria bacterium]|nr:type II secretion system protein GspN [Deltaproteobacteria bacterium]